jgi:hypothetical protein
MSPVRRDRVAHIDALLDEIAEQRQRLYVLTTYGVRPAGMRGVKQELRETHERLAELRAAPVH